MPADRTLQAHKPVSGTPGFTLIELMITVAIIAILATLFIPSNLVHRQRSEVTEAMHMSDTIRDKITAYYYQTRLFPDDNKEAGLPAADKLIGNKVSRIDIEKGAIHITLGNKVLKSLQGKVLSIRPAVVIGSPASPISWLCGYDEPVKGMQAVGKNKTDLKNAVIPACGY